MVAARLGVLLVVLLMALAGSSGSVVQATAQHASTRSADLIREALPATTPISNFANCLEPGFDYDTAASGPPVAKRLAVNRSCGDGLLQAVDPSVHPTISGERAYRLCGSCQGASPISEELLYYSAPTPATIPARCEPKPGPLIQQMPPDCSTATTPLYQHRLVWFFISKGTCAFFGPMPLAGAPPYPTSLTTCVWFTDVDATTGQQGFATSG